MFKLKKDEYGDEVVTNLTAAEGWKEVAASYSSRLNFHPVLDALDSIVLIAPFSRHVYLSRCPGRRI